MTKRAIVLMAAVLLLLACDATDLTTVFVSEPTEEALDPALAEALDEELPETPTEPQLDEPPPTLPTLTATLPPASPLPPPSPASEPSSVSNPFADALRKAKTASKYRVEFKMLLGATQAGKYQEMVFLDMVGAVAGKNMQLTSKGEMLALLGGDQRTPIEIIVAGGKTYMKGIMLLGMTNPQVWYVQQDSSGAKQFGEFTKPDYYDTFTRDSWNEFKKVRSESLDRLKCDVYACDYKSAQNVAILTLLGTVQNRSDLTTVDKADANIWLCADGYVHKFVLDFQGHNQRNPAEKGTLKINMHLWGYGSPSINIQAPKDALPLPR